jgi:hypothetical protein
MWFFIGGYVIWIMSKLSYQNFEGKYKIHRLMQEQVKILNHLPDGAMIVEQMVNEDKNNILLERKMT